VRLKRIFPNLNGKFMFSIITEITRRKLFRYASSEIYISAIEKRNREDKISLFKPGAPGVLPLFDNIFLNLKANI
jgi:hypothetical protein